MNHALRTTLLGLLIGTTGATWAEGMERIGFYAGAGIGQAYSDIDDGNVSGPLKRAGYTTLRSSSQENDTIWKLYGGAQFNRYLGLEASVFGLGDYSIKTDLGTTASGRVKTRIDLSTSVALSAVAGIPLGERFRVFAKAGAFHWDAKVKSVANLASGNGSAKADDDGIGLTLGLGASVDLTKRFAVRADWDHYRVGGDVDIDINAWTLGVQYRF